MALVGWATVSAPWKRIRRYASACVRIDARSLAVFRMIAGALIVADLLLRARNFSFYYTDDGAVPRSLAMAVTRDNTFSIYHFTTDPTIIALLFVVQGLIAVQLIVGYRTRLATILAFLFVVSLDHHNPFVLSYADTLFRLLLFWAIFLPLGERWSIDAVHADTPPRESVANLASTAILLQMVYMYFVNGLHKTGSTLWLSGEATVLIFGLDDTTFLLGDFMRNFPTLLEYGGLLWFYLLLGSVLLVLLPGRPRMLLVGLLFGGHAAFAITVRIGAFPYVAIAGLVLFLQAQFWKDVEAVGQFLERFWPGLMGRFTALSRWGARTGRRVPYYRLPRESIEPVTRTAFTIVLVIAFVSIMVLPAASLVEETPVVDTDHDPAQHVDDTLRIIGVNQPPWTVFAPNPRTVDRYYVFPALTTEGDRYDVYNDRELTFERPHDELQKQYGTYRERFYMNSVRRAGSHGEASRMLAVHLCDTWTDEDGAELTHVNMYVVTERVTQGTIDDQSERDRDVDLIYRHGCGDNSPRVIEPPDD